MASTEAAAGVEMVAPGPPGGADESDIQSAKVQQLLQAASCGDVWKVSKVCLSDHDIDAPQACTLELMHVACASKSMRRTSTYLSRILTYGLLQLLSEGLHPDSADYDKRVALHCRPWCALRRP